VAELERRLAGGHAVSAAGAAQPSAGGEGAADPKVVDLLRAGKDVQATALVHKQKGSSLAEAKADVDRLKVQLSL
jgi:hypothetical protein